MINKEYKVNKLISEFQTSVIKIKENPDVQISVRVLIYQTGKKNIELTWEDVRFNKRIVQLSEKELADASFDNCKDNEIKIKDSLNREATLQFFKLEPKSIKDAEIIKIDEAQKMQDKLKANIQFPNPIDFKNNPINFSQNDPPPPEALATVNPA